jgi:DNA-binding MltR family transcriptional regulator
VAYCLGLITRDQRDDLKAIARIRNRFAHDFNVTDFGDPPIRDQCTALKSPADLAAMPSQLFPADVAEQIAEFLAQTTATPRERFRTTVIFLFGALLRRVYYVRREHHQWFSYDPDAPKGPSTPS